MLQIILIVTYIRGLHLTPMQLNAAGSNRIAVVEFQSANAWFNLFFKINYSWCYVLVPFLWDHPFKTLACLRGGGGVLIADGLKVTVHKDQKSPS